MIHYIIGLNEKADEKTKEKMKLSNNLHQKYRKELKKQLFNNNNNKGFSTKKLDKILNKKEKLDYEIEEVLNQVYN